MTEKMTICRGYGKETFSISQINIYLAIQIICRHRKCDVQWHPLQLSQMHLKCKSKQISAFCSHWSYLGPELLKDGRWYPIFLLSGTPFHPDNFWGCFVCYWKAHMHRQQKWIFTFAMPFWGSDGSDRYFDMACWQKTGKQAHLGQTGKPLK